METLIRAAAIYAVLLILLRLSGRRTLAQMTPFDLVLLLIVSEAAQQALLGEDFSLTNAALVILTLIGIDVLLSYIKRSFPAADKWIDGRPTILVAGGVPDEAALRKARVDLDDIRAAARIERGLATLDDVAYAILEPDGRISIINRAAVTEGSPRRAG